MGDGPWRMRVDRMEELMLGDKRSVPLWRQRRIRLLPLEQSLAAGRAGSGAVKPATVKPIMATKDIKVARAKSRVKAETRRMGRFSES